MERTNIPTDSGFQVLNTVEDTASTQKLDPEVKRLAKAAKSPDGAVILNHLKARLSHFETILKKAPLSGGDNVTVLAELLAARQVIAEFESVINDCEIAVKAVADAARRDKSTAV
jgi:hypothetical protein